MIATILFKTGITLVLLLLLFRASVSFFDLKEYDIPAWVYAVVGGVAILTVILFVISSILFLWS